MDAMTWSVILESTLPGLRSLMATAAGNPLAYIPMEPERSMCPLPSSVMKNRHFSFPDMFLKAYSRAVAKNAVTEVSFFLTHDRISSLDVENLSSRSPKKRSHGLSGRKSTQQPVTALSARALDLSYLVLPLEDTSYDAVCRTPSSIGMPMPFMAQARSMAIGAKDTPSKTMWWASMRSVTAPSHSWIWNLQSSPPNMSNPRMNASLDL